MTSDQMVRDYANWIKSNWQKAVSAGFAETHVPEIEQNIDENGILPISEAADFLKRVLPESRIGTSPRIFTALVFELSVTEENELFRERRLLPVGSDYAVQVVNKFTPPSLYLLTDPMDLLFERAVSIQVIECQTTLRVAKLRTKSDSESRTHLVLFA